MELSVDPATEAVEKTAGVGNNRPGCPWGFVDFRKQVEIRERVCALVKRPGKVSSIAIVKDLFVRFQEVEVFRFSYINVTVNEELGRNVGVNADKASVGCCVIEMVLVCALDVNSAFKNDRPQIFVAWKYNEVVRITERSE